MGKGKDKKSIGSGIQTCARCKSFKPGKGGAGRCARRDKKRDAKDKACGRYDPR